MTDSAPVTIGSLARIVRSKNAGPFQFTVDVLFASAHAYLRVRDSGALTRSRVAAAYGVSPDRVSGPYFWDAALAVKVTLDREISAGAPGDNDCYGAQQHAPLLVLPVREDTRPTPAATDT